MRSYPTDGVRPGDSTFFRKAFFTKKAIIEPYIYSDSRRISGKYLRNAPINSL